MNTIRLMCLLLISVITIPNAEAQLLKKIKSKISSTNSEKLEEFYKEDQGMTSDTHKKYLGQIVFSDSPLSFGNYTESSFKQNYDLGDPLFFRAFFEKSLYNMLVDHYGDDMFSLGDHSITVKYYINDQLKFQKFQHTLNDIDFDAMKKWTTLRGVLAHPTEDYQLLQWTFKDFMIEHPGFFEGNKKYKLGVELVLATEDQEIKTIAKGGIQVDQTTSGISKIYESSSIGLPQSKMDNPALQQLAFEALKDHVADKGWKESYVDVILTSSDWTVLRNKLSGEIVGRTIEIAGVGKWPNGECQYKFYDIFQNYVGAEFTGKLSIRNVGGGYTIPCNLLE